MKNIYSVYSSDGDMTFIMEETAESVEVKGFYFGKPDDNSNQLFYGSLKADFSLPQKDDNAE